MIVYKDGGQVIFRRDDFSNIRNINIDESSMVLYNTKVGFAGEARQNIDNVTNYTDIRDGLGVLVGDKEAVISYLSAFIGVKEVANPDLNFTDGGLDVILQDSTSPLLIVPVSNITITTTLAVPLNRDSYTITVTDASAFTTEDIITVYNAASDRVFFTHPITVVGNVITCTMPSDFDFPAGSPVTLGSDNMNVNGSVTPQIFGVRNPTADDIPLQFDISRVIIKILTNTAVDLSKFGDIVGGLTRGVLVRRVDGVWQNLFHFDSNGELKNLCYDVEFQLAAGNQQDGLTARFSFSGQDKLGSVVRIRQGEDMQVVIQDDLTSLVRFRMYAEGSIVRVSGS